MAVETVATSEVVSDLRKVGVEADDSHLQRALYSTDASLYRVVPTAVAFPRDADQIEATLSVCRNLNVPLTMRGAGTSVAGNAIGTGVVLDVSRHMNRIKRVDKAERIAVVQPGVIQADLQRVVAAQGLRFGPDPSTSNRCTIGGMIGNNACGSRALGYGRTSDNVTSLDVLLGTGERLVVDRRQGLTLPFAGVTRLRELITANEELIRREFGRFPRQVSGYALICLLPENNFDIGGLLVGSEGTLALTLEATVNLVTDAPERALLALGYESMAEAADAAPAVLPFGPAACEGLDVRIIDAVRTRLGAHRVPPLPKGSGWLLVELTGESVAEIADTAGRVVAAAGAVDSLLVTDPVDAAALWRIREDGAGLASRTPAGNPAYAGWEDAAVPPQKLGAYLRDFEALMQQHHITGMPYGHFGDGCIHVRLDYPLSEANGAAKMRSFISDAADLVVKYGGSLSGEHGDGRARSEMLARMYSPEALKLFADVKAVFDPDALLNPGVIVNPPRIDSQLRVPDAHKVRKDLGFSYHDDHGDFSEAVHRCVGVGKCRADLGSAGVMCPSYVATKDEKDSTRGRARVLQEMINSSLVDKNWRSSEVHEALDLCLSCKGCSTDCPTGVDMATYKSEVLYQSYKGRIRPRSHYALGWLPAWAKVASKLPRMTNLGLRLPGLARLGKSMAGVDQRRSLPEFAPQTFRAWFARHEPAHINGPSVALWVDTFTNYFDPSIGIAAVAVLEDAGLNVRITDNNVCCGLTWISTGQLKTARRKLSQSVGALTPFVDKDIPVVGLEPSCTATLRSDLPELLNDDRAGKTAANIKTLAEMLQSVDGWQPPDLSSVNAVAQPHCHQSAVMGWGADADLLSAAGANIKKLGGCCGLAGNFGVEKGHYDVSVAVAGSQLLPALRDQAESDVVLSDGFSCRTQLADLTERQGTHLAQLLASRLKPEHRL
jgi:FAD/FMN-containing dehydrogenase/Fe-S oxidoreductase